MDFEQLEESAFDNFDPDFYDPSGDDVTDSYDEYNGRKGKGKPARVVQKAVAYFDIIFSNPTAAILTFELFNYLRSFVRAARVDYAPAGGAVYGYLPLNTREGMEALLNNVVPVGNRTPANESNTSDAGFVGFDKTGSLILTPSGAFNVATIGKVTCSQFPYSGLLESSGLQPFKITRIRQTVTNDEQISRPITLFRNSFLGSKSQNEINPRNYFSPNQFQNKIVDVPVDFVINGQSGILYTVNPGETVQWNVQVENYRLLTTD